MRVITTNKIRYENHSNAFGDKFKDFIQKQKSDGSLFNKAKGLVANFKDNQGQGASSVSQPQQQAPIQQPITPSIPKKKGLSKGAIIGISVGGAVVLGLIVFLVTRPKK